jgi:hypothetical protein
VAGAAAYAETAARLNMAASRLANSVFMRLPFVEVAGLKRAGEG